MNRRLPSVPFFIYLIVLVIIVAAEARLHLMTSSIIRDTRKRFSEYVITLNGKSDVRSNSQPLLLLHSKNSLVYGTAMVFVGYGKIPSDMHETALVLFRAQFNVIVLTADGYDRAEIHWPKTEMRNGNESKAISRAIGSSYSLRNRAMEIIGDNSTTAFSATNSSIIELKKSIFTLLNTTEVGNVSQAIIEALNPGGDRLSTATRSKIMQTYFISDHQRIAARALFQYSLGASLPGPINAVAHSYGATGAFSIAAVTSSIENIVLLAPNFALIRDSVRKDHAHFVNILRALDYIPGNSLLAAQIAAQQAVSNPISDSVRSSGTRTFAFLAEDDSEIDVQYTREIVEGKLGGRAHVYKAELELGNQITADAQTSVADAMMDVMIKFLKGYTIDTDELEVEQEIFTDEMFDDVFSGPINE